MIIEETPDVDQPVEAPARSRPLSAAETLARALGTAPVAQPGADTVDPAPDDDPEH